MHILSSLNLCRKRHSHLMLDYVSNKIILYKESVSQTKTNLKNWVDRLLYGFVLLGYWKSVLFPFMNIESVNCCAALVLLKLHLREKFFIVNTCFCGCRHKNKYASHEPEFNFSVVLSSDMHMAMFLPK